MLHYITNIFRSLAINKPLIDQMFKEVKLLKLITDAYVENCKSVVRPRGYRLGYMGHVLAMVEEVFILLEAFPILNSEYIGNNSPDYSTIN